MAYSKKNPASIADAYEAAVMGSKPKGVRKGAIKKIAPAPKKAVATVAEAVKKGAVVTKPTEGSRGASVVLPAAAKKAAPVRKRGA